MIAPAREGFKLRRKTQDSQDRTAAGGLVERITFGRADLEPNRLILGDNLSVMRLLAAESVDLVYADPPFFSGRQHRAAKRGTGTFCAQRRAGPFRQKVPVPFLLRRAPFRTFGGAEFRTTSTGSGRDWRR